MLLVQMWKKERYDPGGRVGEEGKRKTEEIRRRGQKYVRENLPQICTASALANMKPTQMQYRFAVIYETLSMP